MKIALVSFSISSNRGLPLLTQVLERVSFALSILKISDVYETHDKNNIAAQSFLTSCVEVQTDMDGTQLFLFLKETCEQLDVDGHQLRYYILDLRGEHKQTPKLTLPYPETHLHAYLIIPLAEIEPDWEHPILKKSATELAKQVFWPGWGSFFASKQSVLDF